MSNRPQRGSIRPKLTNIPRKSSVASTYLEAYKLAVEKARLQEELDAIEARQKQIDCRMAQIEAQSAKILAASAETGETPAPAKAPSSPRTGGSSSFETFAIDY